MLGRGAGAAGAGEGEGEGEGDGACAVGDSGGLDAILEDAGALGEPQATSATAPASTASFVILIWRDYRHGYTQSALTHADRSGVRGMEKVIPGRR